MKKEFYFEFVQETAASTWDVNNVPDGAIDASITEVFADGGIIMQPESQLVAPDPDGGQYHLQLSFGVNEVSGRAIGKYYLNVDDTTVTTDGSGNTVNITVTQNGGAAPTGATF